LTEWEIRRSRSWRIISNRNQNLLGKLCIVLLRHEESVAGLSPPEWAELHRELRWAVERLTVAFQPAHFNHVFLQNQDRHVHLHVIPRYSEERRFGGQAFNDPDYPNHYGLGTENILGAEFAAAVKRALILN
jgi:diadenosine tetraphosphate (Ap4A) HIT family hydrolase